MAGKMQAAVFIGKEQLKVKETDIPRLAEIGRAHV